TADVNRQTRRRPLVASDQCDRRFNIVIDARRSQESIVGALVYGDPRLCGHVVIAPADAVVLDGAAHTIVRDGAVLDTDPAPGAEARAEERAEFGGAVVGVVRAHWFAEVPVRRKDIHDRFGVTGGERGLVATDDVAGMGRPRLEDGRPE